MALRRYPRAKATIKIPHGSNPECWIASELLSPGLWGVESDSDEQYFQQVYQDERDILARHARHPEDLPTDRIKPAPQFFTHIKQGEVMKIYTAYFYTDAEYASTEIEADTSEQALTAARKLDEEQNDDLYFEHYDEGFPVNHIEILDEDRNELAHWRDADLLLRIAAPELLNALEDQTNAAGDLAAAVRSLDASIATARAAIATVQPPSLEPSAASLPPWTRLPAMSRTSR